MRNPIVGFLRQAANAIHASKILERRPGGRAAAKPGGRRASPKGGRERSPVSERPSASGALVVDGVSIEYTPSMDGDPDPGEIVWAWVPFEEDPTQGKDRPVVVIGRRTSGRGRQLTHQLVGVPLTSKRDERDPQVPVGTGPWDREGRPSYARIDRLLPLEAQGVRREGAILGRDRFDDVIAGLRRLHGS